MNTEQFEQISKIVSEEMAAEQDNKLVDDLRERFQSLKLNLRTRKKIAKSLSIDEKKALNWKTVGDIFSFLDTSTLARDHPEEASRILKIVAGIVGIAFPVALPVTGAIILLPTKVAAKLVEYLGKPTPEHIVHAVADYQAEKFSGELAEGNQQSNEGTDKAESSGAIEIKQGDIDIIDNIERLHGLYQKGIITEEEFVSKKDALLTKLG